MNHLPIDPDPHSSRRAWLPCPNCNHGHDCPPAKTTTTANPIGNTSFTTKAPGLLLQCPTCAHLWTVDTAQARSRQRDVVATIALGGHACDVVISPDGDRIYATTAKSVTVIDRAHRVVANIPVDVDPKRTMVSPDGSRLYVIGYNGSISIINAADFTVRTVVREASTAEIVSPADNYLYLAHNQGRNCWVSAMSEDGTTATAVPVDSYASALALSPDGSRLYVASSRPRSTRQRHHGSISKSTRPLSCSWTSSQCSSHRTR